MKAYPILHNDLDAVSKRLQGVPQHQGSLYQQQQVAAGAGGIMMVGGGGGGLGRMPAVLLDDDDENCSTVGLAIIMARCLICTGRTCLKYSGLCCCPYIAGVEAILAYCGSIGTPLFSAWYAVNYSWFIAIVTAGDSCCRLGCRQVPCMCRG
jgi:hypothetical protein